ncbi:MAG: hypothetical protein IJS37_02870 [Bacilli bacterium]|nr:hypothetical protein [Bacilli bacterium]
MGKKTDETLLSFKALVSMQLRAFFPYSFQEQKKKALIRLILYLLGVAAITGILYLVLFLLGFLGVFGIGGRLPIPVWNVLFFLFLIVNFFSCLNRVTSSLYFSEDNRVLLSLPLSPQRVFLSKLIVLFIQELVRSCFTFLPLLVSIGIAYNMPVYYFFWQLITIPLLSLLPLALSAVISIPTFYIKRFLKRYPLIQSLIVLAILIAGTVGIFVLTSFIPEDLALASKWPNIYFPAITSFTQQVNTVLLPFAYLTAMCTGYLGTVQTGIGDIVPLFSMTSLIPFGVVVTLIVGGLGLSSQLAKRVYSNLSVSSFEHDVVKVKEKKSERPLPSFVSFLKKELFVEFRSTQALTGNYLLFIVTPLATLLLNVVFNSMKKSFTGQLFTLLFNGLIIALIAMATSVSMASVYSREGNSSYLLHSSPMTLRRALLSKLFLRALLMTASLALTIAVYANNCTLDYVPMATVFFSLYFMYLGHLLWSAELDYMHPKIGLYRDGGKSAFNPNEAVSTVLAFLFAFIFAGLMFFFAYESIATGFYRLLAFSAFFFLARLFFFLMRIKGYRSLPQEGGRL